MAAFAQSDISFNGITGYQAIDLIGSGFEVVAVPEPSSIGLFCAAGLLGMASFRARRRAGSLSA